MKAGRGGFRVEIRDIRFVEVGTLVVTVVELEEPVSMCACVYVWMKFENDSLTI